jgi:uncharacterized protein DUF4331
MKRTTLRAGLTTLAMAASLVPAFAPVAPAASHREAPLIALDPPADITDVYAFVSYDAANLARDPGDRKVTLIMNVIPGQEPSSGPNYYAFDDNVLYAFHVDNDRDGKDDVTWEVRFTTTTTNPSAFIANGLTNDPNTGALTGAAPITALEGPGSEGLSRKQRYTVTELRNCKKGDRSCKPKTVLFEGQTLSAVPSNIGPRTTPSYEALAAQGVFSDDASGARVFAGQRAETFAIDLGAVFDLINLRVETPPARLLPALSNAEDANDFANSFGVNSFSGFNINTIALELPISRVTKDHMPAGDANKLIGVYASTSRTKFEVHRGEPGKIGPDDPTLRSVGDFRQVSRMGNPLVNELIIPVGMKDFWNASAPEDEAQFVEQYRKLDVAAALQLVSGVPVTPPPRDDVVSLLLTYPGQPANARLAELLRLDLTVPPTAPASIKRLGPFAHDADGHPTPDAAGFPNGRRPNDDVTDLVVRVAGGPNFIANNVGDGVNVNEKGITPEFPFLPTPYDGRNRRHVDPGE